MKLVREYLCDGKSPSDDELLECIDIVRVFNCVVRLTWYYPQNGWHHIHITKDTTLEELKEKLPKKYRLDPYRRKDYD